MATKIRPIVFRINEPEGFVMNASNAQTYGSLAGWESPGYASNYYNGDGKTLRITISEDLTDVANNFQLMYANAFPGGNINFIEAGTFPTTAGTYNLPILANPVPESAGSGMGKYITLDFKSETRIVTDLPKITITILDP